MACRLPGAATVAQFWANLRAGRDTISRFGPDELRAAGVDPRTSARADYVPARGVLAGGECFDYRFFGYGRAEAAGIDPQQRVFLECAATALDEAAVDPGRGDGWIGVFAGCDMAALALDPATVVGGELTGQVVGRDKDFLATRVAYKLGLRGPALTVQTACSTSLVAVHTACQSLLGYECDVALAGGVSLWTPQTVGYLYQEGHILSRDGYCRPFDARAGGTVPSSGAGVVVLKRLDDAVRAGDPIVAVLRGSAVNNDGADKVGFTAPSVAGQRAAIRLALMQADVDPADVGYVEAHGTATPLGDPVEVAALAAAFGPDRGEPCWLGAVKGNIGHTGAASGVAGLIKVAAMLDHRELVPTAHFERPNPALPLADSRFRVSREHQPWRSRLLAGVSSFGIGGTNAHVVVEPAPRRPTPVGGGGPRVLCVSAASPAALDTLRAGIAERVDGGAAVNTVAWTLATGRRRFTHRWSAVVDDSRQAGTALRAPADPASERPAGVVFAFPGQGALRGGAGGAAHRLLPRFRAVFDEAAEVVADRHGIDLATVLRADADPDWPRDTLHQQLALFALGYALARQWQDWGVEPTALLGHSIGEYVAAALAGVWTLPDALGIVHARGQAMRAAPPGRMVAVATAGRPLDPAMVDGVDVAVDAPGHVVLAGPPDRVDELARRLRERGLACRALHTAGAFHSPLMRPAAGPLRAAVAAAPASPATLPFVSNLTGGWADRPADPDYWVEHLCSPVLLGRCADTVRTGAPQVVLELGPGRTLAQALRGHAVVPTLGVDAGREHHSLLTAVGRLWERGVDLPDDGWAAVLDQDQDQDAPRRCALPPHPLEPLPCPRPHQPPGPAEPAAGPVGGGRLLGLGWRQVPGSGADRPVTIDVDAACGDPVDHLDRHAAALPAVAGSAVAGSVVAGLAVTGRSLVDVLGGEPVRPDAARILGWAERHGAAVVDLGHGDPPDTGPAYRGDAARYAWRGRRWWAHTAEPAPEPTGPAAALAVLSHRPGGADLAVDLAARGHRVVAFESLDAAGLPDPAGLVAPAAAGAGLSQRPELAAALDTYAAGLVGRFVLDRVPAAGRADRAALRRALDPDGRLPRLADAIAGTVAARGWLGPAGPGAVAAALDRRDGLEAVRGLRRLLEHCVGAYPDVFAGRRAAVSVLYPDGSADLLRSSYVDNDVAADDAPRCLDALRRTIRALTERTDGTERTGGTGGTGGAGRSGRPLRVLEVGGSDGEFAASVLADLGAGGERVRYHLTDVSTHLLGQARRRLAGAGGVRLSTFDITGDPTAQGLAAGTYDLVVAHNVVHVAPVPVQALGTLAGLLAPGGWLCLVEFTRTAGWAPWVWGLAPGWWDGGERLDRAGWERALVAAGLGPPSAAAGTDDTVLLVAAAPHRPPPRDCAVLYLPAGTGDPVPDWSARLAGHRRAWVATDDSADPAARRGFDPAGDPPPWHHLEVAALRDLPAVHPALWTADGLPGVLRLPAGAADPPPGNQDPGPVRAAPRPAPDALARVWAEVVGTDDDGTDFFAAGGESLLAIHLLARVREHTGVAVPLSRFVAAPTLAGLRELVAASTTPALPDGVIALNPGGAAAPLLLAAPAAGTALCYQALAARLADRPCYGLDLPGLHGGRPASTVEDAAAHHVELIRAARLRGPYLLGGWSVGAMVAHETARQLAARGEPVALVVGLDGYVPDTAGRPLGRLPAYLGHAARLGLRAWYGRLRGAGPVPGVGPQPPGGPDVARVYGASLRAMLRYVPRPAPCASVVFTTGLDPRRRAALRGRLAPLYRQGVEVHPAPGTHETVLDRPHVDRLAGDLAVVLRRFSPRLDTVRPDPS